MIDTGYRNYYPDIFATFSRYGIENVRRITRIVVCHADADHCGASGFLPYQSLCTTVLSKSYALIALHMRHVAIIPRWINSIPR
ncbi:MAG: hypothetical protein WCF90_03025 [Methanomicrobiales archaeon]